jgi:hypothetical protein
MADAPAQVIRRPRGWVVLLESKQIVPVHRDLVTVEQPGFGQNQAAILDATQFDSKARDSLQPAQDRSFTRRAIRFEAGEDEHRLTIGRRR